MKTWQLGVLWLAAGVMNTGCSGLLGLDDKVFEGEGGSGGAGAGGGTTATGGTTSSSTSETGGGGTTTTGTGGGNPELPLHDEFDFQPTTGQTTMALVDRGWLFTWEGIGKEPYEEFGPPNVFPYPGMLVDKGEFFFALSQTFHWVPSKKGLLMYKEIDGDFLLVTDVLVTDKAAPPDTPLDEQAGAGLMLRNPASAKYKTGNQEFVTIHRYGAAGASYVGAAGSKNGAFSSSNPPSFPAPNSGKIALCRLNGKYFAWSKESTWTPRQDMIDAVSGLTDLPDKVQAGLFVYSYNYDEIAMENAPTPNGLKGTFQYIHQYAVDGKCDPAAVGE